MTKRIMPFEDATGVRIGATNVPMHCRRCDGGFGQCSCAINAATWNAAIDAAAKVCEENAVQWGRAGYPESRAAAHDLATRIRALAKGGGRENPFHRGIRRALRIK